MKTFSELRKNLKEDVQPKANMAQIKKWMWDNREDFWEGRDWNMTKAAEACSDHFGDNIDDEDIPEIYFDAAAELQDKVEDDKFGSENDEEESD